MASFMRVNAAGDTALTVMPCARPASDSVRVSDHTAALAAA